MNSYPWVSIVALVACLVLALASWRAHRINARKTVVTILTWGAIIFLVAGFFTAIGR